MNPSLSTAVNVDLHSHTTASDGHLSPTELVDLALTNNVDMLAITDHDTVVGYQDAKKYACTRGLRLISGVEVSTTWAGQGVHIVGLDIDPYHITITQLLTRQAEARQIRCQMILHQLKKVNLPITLEEVQANAGHNHIGRPHIAQVMIDKGYVSNMAKAFKKYLGAGKIGDVKNTWVDLADAVHAIHHGGGIAVIAHPNHYKMTRSKLLRMIDDFQESGGKGIEVISGKQHPDVTRKFAVIANKRALLASTGSDFHRHVAYAPAVGQLPLLPESVTPVWTAFQSV